MIDEFERIEALGTAINSRVRLVILRALRDPTLFPAYTADEICEHGACLSLLARTAGVSSPTTLRHLETLLQAELIGKTTVRRRGRSRAYYRRDEAAIARALDALANTFHGAPSSVLSGATGE
jgi:ArsR family transcriptional regulator